MSAEKRCILTELNYRAVSLTLSPSVHLYFFLFLSRWALRCALQGRNLFWEFFFNEQTNNRNLIIMQFRSHIAIQIMEANREEKKILYIYEIK